MTEHVFHTFLVSFICCWLNNNKKILYLTAISFWLVIIILASLSLSCRARKVTCHYEHFSRFCYLLTYCTYLLTDFPYLLTYSALVLCSNLTDDTIICSVIDGIQIFLVFPILNIFAKFRWWHPLRGRRIQVGYINFVIFDQYLALCGKRYKIRP